MWNIESEGKAGGNEKRNKKIKGGSHHGETKADYDRESDDWQQYYIFQKFTSSDQQYRKYWCRAETEKVGKAVFVYNIGYRSAAKLFVIELG